MTFGKDAIALCDTAKLENAMHHYNCVARMYWKESGIFHIYMQFAESKIMLFGLAAVTIALLFHFMFAKWQNDKLITLYKDTVESVKQQQPVYNFQLPEPRMMHGKRQRVQHQQHNYVDFEDRN